MAWFAALAPMIPMVMDMIKGKGGGGAPAVAPGSNPIDSIGGANLQQLQGQINPLLNQLLANQHLAQTQVQATSEHRELVQKAAFEREMRARLDALQRGQVVINSDLRRHILDTSRGGHGGGGGGGGGFTF